MTFSFSTVWTDNDIERLYPIIPHIDAIEVASRGDSAFFMEIEEMVRDKRIRVSSVHAVAGPHKHGASSSYTPNFASTDESLRTRDLEDILLTAEWASKIGAEVVIFHAGKIFDEKLRDLYLLYKKMFINGGARKELDEMRSELISRRTSYKDILDIVEQGLNHLLREFPDIIFCFETRLHYYEIPLPDEAEELFKRLSLSNLGYWHDIGHAYALDHLGLVPMKEWQLRFGKQCFGVHIHDADKSLVDHYPPGFGLLDLGTILGQFPLDTLFTLEINPRHSEDEILKGINNLKSDIAKMSIHSNYKPED